MDKGELIPIGRVDKVDVLATKLGCKVGSLSSTYLGMPLGAHFKFVAVWNGVKEWFQNKLAM